MRSKLALCAVLALLSVSTSFAGTNTVIPTTRLAAETGNNTSAPDSFAAQSNGNLGSGNISKVPIGSVLYTGSNTPIYAHFMGWFGSPEHMNVGYTSSDPVQVRRQVTDALSRGIGGFILDWYGPNNSMPNATALTLMNEAQSRNGAFSFGIMYDGGALGTCAHTAGCNLTQQAITDLTYAYNAFESSQAYLHSNGRPIVWFFDPDRYGTLNWALIASSVPGNPLFIFRNSSGFTHADAGGSFSWVGLNTSNSMDWGQSYLDTFYSTSLTYGWELTYGSGYKGFNDSLAAWAPSPPRIMSQQCGQVWMDTLSETGRYFLSTSQLDAIQLVTWNDYEEGSELETGIDNCVSLSAAVSGALLNWVVTGNLNTIDHFTVFISSDGQNLMSLGNLSATATSLNLSTAAMAPGNYTLYVKVVGKPSLRNHMSTGALYTVVDLPPVVKVAATPGSGAAPLAATISTSGSYDPDGSITAAKIVFGDGATASGTPATHTYAVPGTYTATATLTDNNGVSSSASVNVKVYGVKVTSPVYGSTSSSPVHVVASASSANPITAMRIYVDNVSRYSVSAASLNTYVSMSSGTHNVVVQAWDSTGAVFKTPVNVTVP